MKVQRLALVLALFLLAVGEGANAEESASGSGEKVVIRPGSKEGVDPEKARQDYIEERLGDRQERMDERMQRQADREALLRGEDGDTASDFFVPRVKVRIGSSLLWPAGSVLKGPEASPGTRLDLGPDLGAAAGAFEADAGVRADLSPKAGLGAECAWHALTGKGTAGADWVYRGTPLPAGERIETRIGNFIGSADVHYLFYADPAGNLTARAGSVYWNQRLVLHAGAAGRIEETLDAFFPFLGVLGAFPLGKGAWFEPGFRIGYLGFEEGEHAQSNVLLEIGLRLRFFLFEHGRLAFGYRFLRLDAKRENRGVAEESKLASHAIEAEVSIRFF
jgi:hypothetical protein